MSQQPTHFTESAANELAADQIKRLLPAMAADWVDMMGVDATLALVRAYPGMQIKVPMGIKEGAMSRRLRELLGDVAAALFMCRHGGEHLTVPRCATLAIALRNEQIRAAYDHGTAVVELVRKHNINERQVRAILGNETRRDRRPINRFSARFGDGNPNQLDMLGGGQ